MADNKRFYWLKLQEDFFEDETIRYIEEQENGIKYSNFYLKLCLKSLRTDGKLIRLVGEMLIPYDVKSLASLTGVDVDTVRCAMVLFEKIGCVKVLDSGELFIAQLSELVGSETDKAKMMRRLRASEKVTLLPECYPEKEIEKEIEKETDKEQEKDKGRKRPTPPERHKYGEYGWVKLSDAEYQRLLSEYGEIEVARAIRHVDESAQNTGNRNGWKDWNLTVRRCIRDGWGKQKGGNYGNGTGINQRGSGSSGPENRPTKRLKNAFDFMAEDQTGAGAGDCGDFQQGTREIDISELF